MSKFKRIIISTLVCIAMIAGFRWLTSITAQYDYFIGVIVGMGAVIVTDIVNDLI